MLKMKIQLFSQLMWRANSLENPLMLGKIDSRRRRGRQKTRWLDSITDYMSLSKLWEMLKDREACCAAVHWVTKGWTWPSNSIVQQLHWYLCKIKHSKMQNCSLGIVDSYLVNLNLPVPNILCLSSWKQSYTLFQWPWNHSLFNNNYIKN